MSYGQTMKFNYGANFVHGTAAIQRMLEGLGGFQIRFYHLAPKVAPKPAHPDRQKRKDGFKFIQLKGPKANNANQFIEWTDEQVNDPASPIYEWNKGDVKESLRAYAQGKTGAKTIEQWPVTLPRFHPEVFNNAIVHILETHDIHSTIWGGHFALWQKHRNQDGRDGSFGLSDPKA